METKAPIIEVMADGWHPYSDEPFVAVRRSYGNLYDDAHGGYLYGGTVHLYVRGPRGGQNNACGKRRGNWHKRMRAELNALLMTRMCRDCLKTLAAS